MTVGDRRLLVLLNFLIEISFKIESFFIEMLPKINQRKLAQYFRLSSLNDFAASLV